MNQESEEKPAEKFETPRNTFLYTNDNFGKLEKDVVFETKTYQNKIRETEIDSFKIIPVKKSRSLKK